MEKTQKRNELINIRKKRGLTQKEVAKYLKISSTYYSQIETGIRDPGREVSIRLSDFYGIEIKNL